MICPRIKAKSELIEFANYSRYFDFVRLSQLTPLPRTHANPLKKFISINFFKLAGLGSFVSFSLIFCIFFNSTAELLLDSNKKDDYAFLLKGSEIAEGIDDVEEYHNTEVSMPSISSQPKLGL